MYTLLISGLILFTSTHVDSVALNSYVVSPQTAFITIGIEAPEAAKAAIARLYPGVKDVK